MLTQWFFISSLFTSRFFTSFCILCFALTLSACVPSNQTNQVDSRPYNAVTAPVVQELPIRYQPLDLAYTVRQAEQPTGLPDLVMLNNSVTINAITTVPIEQSIDVYGLLVDAGIFGGKFLLRLTAYLDSENPNDSFAMHQYDSLILDVDGQKIALSRDSNDIGISQLASSEQGESSYIEFGFYEAYPNLYLILGRGERVQLELVGGKDGIDRRLFASFTQENIKRYAEFYATFDELYR